MLCAAFLQSFQGTSVFLVPRVLPAYVGLHHRCIHARAKQTTFFQRRRKQDRPVECFSSPGRPGKLTKTQSNFVLAPTQEPGPKETAQQRRAMQLSNSPAELLSNFKFAVKAGSCDASVVGAAMQRCGQGRWWDTLLAIRKSQIRTAIKLTDICLSIFLSALVDAIRGRDGIDPARQQKVLMLAKEAWSDTADKNMNPICWGAAFKVCEVSHDSSGLKWATDLWRKARDQHLCMGSAQYSTLVQVMEQYSQRDVVDELFGLAQTGVWSPTRVTLGALVDISARHRDWQRAEEMWHILVSQFKVGPAVIQYTALAKAHFLCGRPAAAVRVFESIPANGKGMYLDSKVAVDHLQALLLVYHSSLARTDKMRLNAALEKGRSLIQKQSSSGQKRVWQQMDSIVRTLYEKPRTLRLQSVLVDWNAKQSDMAKWKNHAAGSKYLSGA